MDNEYLFGSPHLNRTLIIYIYFHFHPNKIK